MLSQEKFIKISLEINLFFQRIMKEHLFFIETSLHPFEEKNIAKAELLKRSFEELLYETTLLSNGAISKKFIKSNELVTPYTLKAEEISSKLTGASLDTNITRAQKDLISDPDFDYSQWLEIHTMNINKRSLNLLYETIEFKKRILQLTLDCSISIYLYPKLLKHLVEEAELYKEILEALLDKKIPEKSLCAELNFWNHIMEEHAQFIDGMLDPSEDKLKDLAERFIHIFEKLVEECIRSSERNIIRKSIRATESIKDFKKASIEGILECEIRSVILPLLADHVLREANHYLRLLKSI
ncbi:DUF2935 domain-containing protein [Wansuia hejianensis]|uniref:DUF2935 domain-containing protein n=1 Tax=Wansuia hejianensis TaxID=2763667 RepID=A0A926EWM2_9FIRM|nr:DUF2935 domain-containing protein [Wansuia hejianensis]MBC8589835.1 DUF2935 domain-containing protein [Wansuia hejianensis]